MKIRSAVLDTQKKIMAKQNDAEREVVSYIVKCMIVSVFIMVIRSSRLG
jgi:hypothetical protein